MHRCTVFAAALLLGFGIAPDRASAITAEDVMRKMGQEQRIGYLTGLIDMLAYQMAAHGDRGKSECINEKFYRAERDDTLKRTYQVMEKFPDKRPEILLTALANQICK